MNTPPKKLTPNTSGMGHLQKLAWQNAMPRRPVAPPAYLSQLKPKPVQPKMANGALNRKPPVAPPVYRPQPVPKVLQTKRSSVPNQRAAQTPRQPVAPPVYRPQAKEMVQPKAITQLRRAPVAPPVYRPEQKRIAQPKIGSPTHRLRVSHWNGTMGTVVQSKRTATSYSTGSRPGRPISHLNPHSPSNQTVQLVAIGDQKEMSDGWMQIRDDTGDWATLVTGGHVTALVPIADFRTQVPAPVNNVNPASKHLGCVLCVLADFLGTTVMDLLRNLPPSKRQSAMTIYQGGLHDAGQILAHLSPMGIMDEEFASYQAFRQTIEESDPEPEWEGALGFGHHIVRASWHAGELKLWDPQLGVRNPAIPTGVPVTLYTFAAGH